MDVSWTIKKAKCCRIDAFELWCWRRLLRVPWTARRTNQSVLKETSPEYPLEGLMLRPKLQHFGHLMWRTDSLEKTLILGKIEGRKGRAQQRMRWLGGITDSMDMSLSELRWWTRGAWRAAVHGVTQSRTCLKWLSSSSSSRQHIKKQRHYFVNKDPSSQGYGFSSGHVWMWELDCEKGWAPKHWCFWTVVLEKTLESPLDCKENQPVRSKGDQPWDFFGRNDAKAETPVLWTPHTKNWLIGKDSDAGRDWGQEEKGTTEDEMAGWHHWFDGHESEWTLGVGDGQGGLVCPLHVSNCRGHGFHPWSGN